MQIRRLIPADAAAYKALRLEMLEKHPQAFAESVEEASQNNLAVYEGILGKDYLFGLFDNNALVGSIRLNCPELLKTQHRANIWGMYVQESYRGRGHAGELIEFALSTAKELGKTHIFISVSTYNDPARKAYSKAGFIAFGREPGAMLVNGELVEVDLMVLKL